MAYNPRNLSILAYANGFTLWHYTTADAPATVGAAGYFNDAADMLRVGDMIMTNAGSEGCTLMVRGNAAEVVDMATMAQTTPPAEIGAAA